MCSLLEIAGGACGLYDLDCPFTLYAKAAEPALQDGKLQTEATLSRLALRQSLTQSSATS